MTANGIVLGLVSGSLNPGGSIAWAIGIENADVKHLQVISAPQGDFRWPPLSLMKGGWENLRRQSGIGAGLADKIQGLLSEAEDTQPQVSELCGRFAPVIDLYSQLGSTIDTTKLGSVKLTNLEAVEGGQALLNRLVPVLNKVNPLAQEVQQKTTPINAAITEMNQRLSSIANSFSELTRDLPSTPTNTAMKQSVVLQVSKLTQQSQVNSNEIASLINDHPIYTPTTVSELQSWSQDKVNVWRGAQQVYCRIFPAQIALMRESGLVYRQLLGADLRDTMPEALKGLK